MSQNPQNPNNLHIATDDDQAEDVGRPEFVTLADKLTNEHITAIGVLHNALKRVKNANLGADAAVEILGDHINALVVVFEAAVPLIQRRLDNYSRGAGETLGATAATAGVQGVLGNIIGPALLNLKNQLPIIQGFLETVKEATTPPVSNLEGETPVIGETS